MDKFTEWITNKFQHPLSLLLFLLGALLILLGVTTEITIPGLPSPLVPQTNYQWVALIIGLIIILLAIVVYYRPPKKTEDGKQNIRDTITIPTELSLGFTARLAKVDITQKQILHYFEYYVDRRFLNLTRIEKEFTDYSKGEILYRLNNLCLLGFLEVKRDDTYQQWSDTNLYSLSSAYKKELGIPDEKKEARVTGSGGVREIVHQLAQSDDHELDEAVGGLSEKLEVLNELALKEECPFCLVGAVYLDVMVSPIDTIELTKDEWSSIEEIKYDIGGSTLWVGRFLLEKGQHSYLFSVIGDENEPHTQQFKKLFEQEENWVLNDNFIEEARKKGKTIGVTVHLIQRNQRFGTMFTYRGILKDFGWERITTQLHNRLGTGGVLYIAGYLKTNLCHRLDEGLGALPKNTLVCIDHGRLLEGIGFGIAIRSLHNAFKSRLIDVYFCSYQEIFDLFEVDHRRNPPLSWEQVYKKLVQLAQKERLPLITMVRGGYIDEKMRAFVIVGKRVTPLEGFIGTTYIRRTVGASNAFNASAMYHLVKERSNTLEDQAINAGTLAFQELSNWTKKPV